MLNWPSNILHFPHCLNYCFDSLGVCPTRKNHNNLAQRPAKTNNERRLQITGARGLFLIDAQSHCLAVFILVSLSLRSSATWQKAEANILKVILNIFYLTPNVNVIRRSNRDWDHMPRSITSPQNYTEFILQFPNSLGHGGASCRDRLFTCVAA